MRRASSERRSINSKDDSCGKAACCLPSEEGKEPVVKSEFPSEEGSFAPKRSCNDALKSGLVAQAKTANNGKTECGSTMPDVNELGIKSTSESSPPCITSCCSTPTEEAKKQGSSCFNQKSGCSVKSQNSAEVGGKRCCSEATIKQSAMASSDDCARGCCSERVPNSITISAAGDHSKNCCSEPVMNLSTITASPEDCIKGCCSGGIVDAIVVNAEPEDKCGNGCCSDPKPFSVTKPQDTMDSCCSPSSDQTSDKSARYSKARCEGHSKPTNIQDDSNYAKCGGGTGCKELEILPFKQTISTNELDLEKGVFDVEHLMISVQGMTCTGCEKSLAKALTSMPAISNIKTSLVLGRAEFDLRTISSDATVVDTIKTLEKMTGFTCAKMTLSGHELDLIVETPSLYLDNKALPFGISEVVVLDSRTIRVIYSPEVMGARDLMAHPFFESAKLAPLAAPPLIASGQAHLRSMLFKTLVSTVLTIPVLVLSWADLPPREIAYGAASMVLATIVQLYIAGPWYLSAFKALFFSRMVEVDFLVVLSTSTAYIYSIIAYAFLASRRPLSTGSFFETSTLLVTLIMVGRLVTSLARQRAVESISIESLQPSTAILVNPKSGTREEIDTRLLQYGDVFVVLSVGNQQLNICRMFLI